MAGKFDLGQILANQEMQAAAKTRDIDTITAEILENKRKGGEAVLSIGRGLIEAKALLDHGAWLPWLTEQVDFSERTAQSFMRLAKEWTNPQTLADLGKSKALALLAIPAAEREQFIEANPVAEMSTRQLQEAIAERDAARQQLTAADEEREKLAAQVDSLKSAQALAADITAKKDAEIVQLRAELKTLQDQPVDVAVMEVDQQALEAARSEAAAEATAAMQAKLDKTAADREKAISDLQAKLDKSKAAADKAKENQRKAEEALQAAEAKLEAVSKDEKRESIAADEDLTMFRVVLESVVEQVNKLHGMILKVRSKGREADAEKLGNALQALADQVRRAAT